MKKILLSLATLAIVGIAVVGGTTAIFSDTEVSTGNTFTAGAIDLTIDNESYLNGVFNEGTSWLEATDLIEGVHLFFDFDDLKPGDWGEDTISLHVNNNDSWLCVDVTLKTNQDNGSTEPELNDETPYTAGRGELADNVNFIWWADDGDNVLEVGEQLLPSGPLGNLGIGETATVPLADSNTNIWLGSGPIVGGDDYFIGKAWCFGDLTLTPVAQDKEGHLGKDVNGPLVRGAGFSCDGSGENNETQTDSMTADISFRAVQSRNNGSFVCVPENVPTVATLTVDKRITFTSVSVNVEISDFELHVEGPSSFHEHFTDEVPWAGLAPGTYTVSETQISGDGFVLDVVFGLDCSEIGSGNTGTITLSAGDNKTCQVTNEVAPSPST